MKKSSSKKKYLKKLLKNESFKNKKTQSEKISSYIEKEYKSQHKKLDSTAESIDWGQIKDNVKSKQDDRH